MYSKGSRGSREEDGIYMEKKSNRHKHFDLSQFCNPLLTIATKH